jgi:hypothetical protein
MPLVVSVRQYWGEGIGIEDAIVIEPASGSNSPEELVLKVRL